MKGLIIYATCYGSTKTYADWIAEETGFPAVSCKMVTDQDIEGADTVVIGSWVLASKLFIAKWLKEKKDLLKDKTLYVFSVSGAKPGDKELDHVFSGSLEPELIKSAKTYQFGGRRETKKMSGFHRFMLFIAATFIAKDKDRKEAMKKYVDNVDRQYTKALLQDMQ